MKTNIILSGALVLLLTGCSGSDGKNGKDSNVTVDMNISLPSEMINETDLDINKTIDTFKYNVTSEGGLIEVKTIIKDNGGKTDFIIVHSIDNDEYNSIFPVVAKIGNLLEIRGDVYIPPNDTDSNKTHNIKIKYYSNNEIQEVGEFDLIQSPISEDDVFIKLQNFININDDNNTINIESNSTSKINK